MNPKGFAVILKKEVYPLSSLMVEFLPSTTNISHFKDWQDYCPMCILLPN